MVTITRVFESPDVRHMVINERLNAFFEMRVGRCKVFTSMKDIMGLLRSEVVIEEANRFLRAEMLVAIILVAIFGAEILAG